MTLFKPSFRTLLYVSVAACIVPGAAYAQSTDPTSSPGGTLAPASTVGPVLNPQPQPGSAAAGETGSATGAAAAVAGTSGTQATEGRSSSPQAQGVEEIVVTAQKREQNLQNVPISITALSQNALVANRIQTVRDLSAVVPNLTVRPSSGGAQIPNYILRGIFTGGSALGTDKGVALYIDGVYLQSATGSIFELADIERLEVLEGPQGTLFGRNATGGAISVITANPTGVFGASQAVTYGNYNQLRLRTHVDLPKWGPLSVSATYLHSERDGDTKNLGAGTQWDYGPATNGAIGVRTSPKRFGDQNVEGVIAAAKLDLDPNLDLIYKFDYTQNHYTPEATGVAYLPTTSFLLPLYNQEDPALRTPITTKRPGAVNNWWSAPGYSRNIGHNFTAAYRISDVLSVKNILAFRQTRTISQQQGDGLGGLYNNPIPVGGGVSLPPAWFPGGNPGAACLTAVPSASCLQSIGKPFNYVVYNSLNDTKQWSDEFQLNVKTDWFNITAGYLHFDDRQTAGAPDNTINVPLLTAFYGQNTSAQGTAFTVPGNAGYNSGRIHVVSDAFYVQPEFHLTSNVDLVLGGRLTKDRKDGREYFPAQPAIPDSVPIRYRDSEFNYLVGVNYKPADNILTYLKYSTGYISGGQLATVQFQPEKARSAEGGVKADLFDRHFRSNLAVFYAKYNKIQYTTGGSISGVDSARLFGSVVISSADAKAYGAEWQNTIVPFRGLTLTANAGYLHFKFLQSTVFPGLALVSGAPGYLPFARPKFTGSVAAQYETPEILAGGHFTFRVDGNFTSKTLLSSDVTDGSGPTDPEDPALRAAATVKARFITNARISLADFKVANQTATVAVWGRNLSNNRDIAQFLALGPLASVLYEPARTYGVDFSVKF